MNPILSGMTALGGALSGFAPLITGGASLLGSLFTSDTSAQNTQAQIQNQQLLQAQSEQFNANQAAIGRDWNAQAIQNQQQFQTQMSNTAYQRASADMKAAGLNPMMMFGSGGAASSPSGSMASSPTASIGTATAPTPQKTSALAGLSDAVKTAMSTAVQQKEMDLLTSKTAQVDLDNRMTRRTLGIPELINGEKVTGMPELQQQSVAADVKLKQQQELLNSYSADEMRLWNTLSQPQKDLILAGKATIRTIGDIAGAGLKAGIGTALTKWSAKGDAPVAINQMDAVSAARKAIVDAGGRPKASDVLDLANQLRGKINDGRSNLIQY